MYQDFQKYGIDKFVFEILEEVEVECLKETEQKFIENLKPSYNDRNAKGIDINKYKEWQREYEKSDKRKEYMKEYNNKYYNQLCCYNGEVLTLNALRKRFQKSGIAHSVIEAKKYIIKN